MIAALCCAAPRIAAAEGTASLMGPLGLIAVPSARMDAPGTMRAHVSIAEPYVHAAAGVQIAGPLYIGVRQSARSSSLRADPDRLYPGVDIKLRLVEESAYVPDITLGLQSAIGHRRMAAEYLAFSKRYENWNFTGGVAWGRLGSAAHMNNPLNAVSKHFGKRRPLDGEMPNGPENWFTGEDIGFFAGAAYDTPWIHGLQLKAEWGADRYAAERAAFGHDAPAPWAAGFSYRPRPWAEVGAALIGGERVMASLNLRAPLERWFGRSHRADDPPPLRPHRGGSGVPGTITQAAAGQDITLADTGGDSRTIWTRLEADPHAPLPRQIGRAGRVIASHGGPDAEAIEITPMHYGLRGPAIRVLRRDLEQAFARGSGSPQEIWRNAAIGGTDTRPSFFAPRLADAREKLRLVWDTQLSLAEEDSGLLYRTGLIVETAQQLTRSLMAGGAIRLNLAGNLERLNEARPASPLPVREDIDAFSANTINMDRLYFGWFKSLNTDVHVMLSGGYLEEMYAGAGGEVLYRPYGKTFAIGAEAWQVFKRDPYTGLSQGLTGDSILTGHVNAWYEIPGTELTLHARAGRYLAGDVGGTLALRRRFAHGGYVEAFATATDGADIDPFGGATHIYSGLRFIMPLGNIKPLPAGSEIRIAAAQMGRQSGQALDRPRPLYDMTEPFSARRIAADWNTIGE